MCPNWGNQGGSFNAIDYFRLLGKIHVDCLIDKSLEKHY